MRISNLIYITLCVISHHSRHAPNTYRNQQVLQVTVYETVHVRVGRLSQANCDVAKCDAIVRAAYWKCDRVDKSTDLNNDV